METVLTSGDPPLVATFIRAGFWAGELDGFLLDLFVAGMRVSAVSWNQRGSEMRIVEEM